MSWLHEELSAEGAGPPWAHGRAGLWPKRVVLKHAEEWGCGTAQYKAPHCPYNSGAVMALISNVRLEMLACHLG